MSVFLRTFRMELSKILMSRTGYITIAIVLLIQPLFAYIEARSFLDIGLNATPQTNPDLLVAIPPLEYIGFDVVLFGILPMVIFGGIIGASEFSNHSLRTTLLCQNNRHIVFWAKLWAVAIVTLVIAGVTNYLTLMFTHIALGHEGLNPYILSGITWEYIGYTILFWVLLTLIAYGMGLLFRNALIPLFFLIPQVYNLGSYLAQKWDWATLLPVAAGNLMIASPTDILPHEPLKGSVTLALWVIIIMVVTRYFFVQKDVGGEY